jgi:zona occludens toxin (predicted ATPase)
MIKLIQRTTDNKYLQSVETDSWVDNVKDAYEMTYRECETAKTELLNTYTEEQLKLIANMRKSKTITEEEKQELINLLKNK